jgi:ribulose-phosphate 3-epimerase
MSEIIPAILPKSEEDLHEKAEILRGIAPLIHLDVLEEEIWDEIEDEFEVHLMVEDPEVVMGKWLDRGARRVAVHSLSEEILMHQHLAEIGLAVLMDTPIEEVFPLVSTVDYIHLMSIDEIGEQGNAFDPRIFDRIKKLRENFPECVIAVDGGIKLDNADDLIVAGVDRLIVGSAIYAADDPESEYEKFLHLL